jgi:hypothetical protein
MLKNLIIKTLFVLLIIIICIGIVVSESVPRVEPYAGKGLIDPENPNKVPQENSVNANFPDDYGQIRINKYVTPKFQDYYIQDQAYLVHVKISGIGRTLDNISIKEEVPSALQIDSFKTCPYIVDPFDNSSTHNILAADLMNETKLMSTWKENYTNNSNSIFIKINRLKPKRCIVYEYKLIPRRTGTYSDITIVRIGGETSKLPDTENVIEFDVRDPQFGIVLGIVDSYGYTNKPLNATYNIVHVSGSCLGKIPLNISFNNTTKYNISWNERSIELIPFKSKSINVSIYYKEAGLQYFPPIIINDRTNPLEEKDVIIYYNELSKSLEDLQNLFNSTPFMIMLYGIIIYIFNQLYLFNKISKKIDESTDVMLEGENKIDNDLKKLTEVTKECEKYYEYIGYQNIPSKKV